MYATSKRSSAEGSTSRYWPTHQATSLAAANGLDAIAIAAVDVVEATAKWGTDG